MVGSGSSLRSFPRSSTGSPEAFPTLVAEKLYWRDQRIIGFQPGVITSRLRYQGRLKGYRQNIWGGVDGWMMMDGSNAGGYWGRGELRGKIECGVVSRVLGGFGVAVETKPFFRRDTFVHVIYPIHGDDESSKQPLFNSGFVPRRPHFLFSTGQTKAQRHPDPIGGLTQTCRKLHSIFLTTVWI